MWQPPGHAAQRREAARLRLHDRRAGGWAARLRPARRGQAGGDGGRSSRRSIGCSTASRSDSPIQTERPPVVDAAARQRPGRLARRRHRRRHGRADRSGALHRQPLDRQDGRRDRPGRARSRRPGDADRRHDVCAACPSGVDLVRAPSARGDARRGAGRSPRCRRARHGRRRGRLPAAHAVAAPRSPATAPA